MGGISEALPLNCEVAMLLIDLQSKILVFIDESINLKIALYSAASLDQIEVLFIKN